MRSAARPILGVSRRGLPANDANGPFYSSQSIPESSNQTKVMLPRGAGAQNRTDNNDVPVECLKLNSERQRERGDETKSEFITRM